MLARTKPRDKARLGPKPNKSIKNSQLRVGKENPNAVYWVDTETQKEARIPACMWWDFILEILAQGRGKGADGV